MYLQYFHWILSFLLKLSPSQNVGHVSHFEEISPHQPKTKKKCHSKHTARNDIFSLSSVLNPQSDWLRRVFTQSSSSGSNMTSRRWHR